MNSSSEIVEKHWKQKKRTFYIGGFILFPLILFLWSVSQNSRSPIVWRHSDDFYSKLNLLQNDIVKQK